MGNVCCQKDENFSAGRVNSDQKIKGKSQYKLYYFKLHAKADPVRAMLSHAKVPFEDIQLGFDEWPKHKPNMPN